MNYQSITKRKNHIIIALFAVLLIALSLIISFYFINLSDKNDQINSKETNYKNQIKKTEDLKKDLKTSKDKNKDLKKDLKTSKDKNKDLEKDLKTSKDKNTDKDKEITALDTKNKDLETANAKLDSANKKLETDLQYETIVSEQLRSQYDEDQRTIARWRRAYNAEKAKNTN